MRFMVHGTARRTPGAVQMGTCQAPFRHALLRGIRSRFRLQSRARAVELAVVMSACVPNSTYVGLRTGRMQVCRSPKREPQCGEDTAAARAARQKKKRMIAVTPGFGTRRFITRTRSMRRRTEQSNVLRIKVSASSLPWRALSTSSISRAAPALGSTICGKARPSPSR